MTVMSASHEPKVEKVIRLNDTLGAREELYTQLSMAFWAAEIEIGSSSVSQTHIHLSGTRLRTRFEIPVVSQ